MASVAVSNITNATRSITGTPAKGTGLVIAGQPVEVFRIASGQTAGDTAVLTPMAIPSIRAVMGPVTHNLPTSGTGATSVTITIAMVQGTAITSTVGGFDVWLIGPAPVNNP